MYFFRQVPPNAFCSAVHKYLHVLCELTYPIYEHFGGINLKFRNRHLVLYHHQHHQPSSTFRCNISFKGNSLGAPPRPRLIHKLIFETTTFNDFSQRYKHAYNKKAIDIVLKKSCRGNLLRAEGLHQHISSYYRAQQTPLHGYALEDQWTWS